MRILFVTPAFAPFPGGGERYVRSLALHLVQLGHNLTVLTSGARRERDFWLGDGMSRVEVESMEGIRVIRCPVRKFPGGRTALHGWRKCMVLLSALPGDQSHLLMKMARRVPALVDLDRAFGRISGKPDIVHGFNASWEHGLIVGWRFACRELVPFVATPFAHFGGGARDRVALNTTMDHQRTIMADADALLTLTSIELDRLRRSGVSPRHADVIGGGLDPLPPAMDVDRMIETFGLTDQYALFVGRASHDKGALHAVDAVLALQKRESKLALGLIGQSTPELERRYAGLNEAERSAIRPLGVLDEGEKHALLEGSTMLLLPSRSDSFGIVILEAWAHGKAVIAANAGGIPEVVDDGQNGLLVEYGDVSALSQAIDRLLNDNTLRNRLGEAGQKKIADQYTWAHVARRVLKNYNRVLASHRIEVS